MCALNGHQLCNMKKNMEERDDDLMMHDAHDFGMICLAVPFHFAIIQSNRTR